MLERHNVSSLQVVQPCSAVQPVSFGAFCFGDECVPCVAEREFACFVLRATDTEKNTAVLFCIWGRPKQYPRPTLIFFQNLGQIWGKFICF